jgi:hypothetical protein
MGRPSTNVRALGRPVDLGPDPRSQPLYRGCIYICRSAWKQLTYEPGKTTPETGVGQEAAANPTPQDLLVDGLRGGIRRRGRGRVSLDAARVLATRGITTIDRSWGGGSWPGCRDVRSPSSDPPDGSVAGRQDCRTCCRTTTDRDCIAHTSRPCSVCEVAVDRGGHRSGWSHGNCDGDRPRARYPRQGWRARMSERSRANRSLG